ncbi:MAG: MATE family efflux transporter [Defluviitaleaceae bacterium]|nr:MATE family efflux transporter [Defluviitaleaceae bacterium]
MAKASDLTIGKPLGLMVRFSIPLLISNVLQLMFTIVDSAIIGRILGVEAFAAIGVTAAPHWLILSTVLGVSHGFGTLIAQRFGAKDMDRMRRGFITAAYLSAIFSIAIAVFGVISTGPLMHMLNTPDEIINGSVIYLRWILGAMPLTMAYNLFAMTLYALGDSKSPLRGMAIAFVLNIIFDLVLVFPFGIAGVALASILAQFAAFVYCFIALRKIGVFVNCSYKWDLPSTKPLLCLALPLGFRNAVIEVGGLVVQRYVNEYGTEFVAGIAVARRMYALIMIAGGAIEASISTFVAQNFGAKQLDRVKKGVRDGMRLALAVSIVIMLFSLFFGRPIMGLLIEGDPKQVGAVLDYGGRQLMLMALGLPVLYMLFLYRAALQGIGNTFIPFLSGVAELIMRLFSVLFLTKLWGEWGVYLSETLGWPAAVLLLVIAYYIVYKQKKKGSISWVKG